MSTVQHGKRCTACKCELPRASFYPHNKAKDGLDWVCRECKRAQSRTYYAGHKRERLAYQATYYGEHRLEVLAYHVSYQAVHRDKLVAYMRAYYAAHRAEWRGKGAAWAAAHPDTVRAVRRAMKHRRRARLKGNGGSHTAAEWQAIKDHYGFRCLMCGRAEPEIELTLDHVQPVTRGGSDDISNVQPLCRECNRRKGATTLDLRAHYDALAALDHLFIAV